MPALKLLAELIELAHRQHMTVPRAIAGFVARNPRHPDAALLQAIANDLDQGFSFGEAVFRCGFEGDVEQRVAQAELISPQQLVEALNSAA